jgi:hypothetical protein
MRASRYTTRGAVNATTMHNANTTGNPAEGNATPAPTNNKTSKIAATTPAPPTSAKSRIAVNRQCNRDKPNGTPISQIETAPATGNNRNPTGTAPDPTSQHAKTTANAANAPSSATLTPSLTQRLPRTPSMVTVL